MKFPKGNKICYFQDHRVHEGIPSTVDFELEVSKEGSVTLRAPGFGKSGDYGNGAIMVRFGTLDTLINQLKISLGDIAFQAIKLQAVSSIQNALDDI
jgi:hypothetical protein